MTDLLLYIEDAWCRFWCGLRGHDWALATLFPVPRYKCCRCGAWRKAGDPQ